MARVKKSYQDRNSLEIARLCAQAALDKKAEDLIILDLRGRSSFADFFVIMSGNSTRHTQGLAEAVEREMGSKRVSSKNSEGLREGVWILLDYAEVIVHIFYREARGFYDLEGLWHDAPRVALETEHAAAER